MALRTMIAALMITWSALGASAVERVSDRVLLVRDKPGSQTKFHMIINAGCLDEAGGQCRGRGHYLEHLVLVGRKPEHKDAGIRMFGDGGANGWTNQRETVYLHSVPARPDGPRADLEKLFGFYAARLRDFNISEEEAVRERNVVLQEHDWRVQSQPYRLAGRDIWRKVLPDHPSGQWTIGTRDDIKAFTLAQAKAYHANWYVPNNAWFVVSGDIDPALLKDIADKALAGVAPRDLPPRNFAKRPEFGTERIEEAIKGPQFKVAGAQAIRLVRMAEPDRAKNRAARAILGAFLRSELPGSPRDVLASDRKLATNGISIGSERVAPETFALEIAADAVAGVETGVLREAIVGYITGLGTGEALSDAVVERLKARMLRDLEQTAKEPAREYRQLITWLANRNTLDDLKVWPATVAAVTGQDVRDIAKAFAGPGRTVTATIDTAGAAK